MHALLPADSRLHSLPICNCTQNMCDAPAAYTCDDGGGGNGISEAECACVCVDVSVPGVRCPT